MIFLGDAVVYLNYIQLKICISFYCWINLMVGHGMFNGDLKIRKDGSEEFIKNILRNTYDMKSAVRGLAGRLIQL